MSRICFPQFPNSLNDPFLATSPKTSNYNCIAWAFEDDSKWYWPDPANIYYWPPDIPREITVSSFIKLYELIGYIVCDNGDFEDGFLKIAIFTDLYRNPTHAARQLSNKYWTSKLGQFIDVQHSIQSMTGGEYGNVEVYMKRKV